jgi:hypothetical protein
MNILVLVKAMLILIGSRAAAAHCGTCSHHRASPKLMRTIFVLLSLYLHKANRVTENQLALQIGHKLRFSSLRNGLPPLFAREPVASINAAYGLIIGSQTNIMHDK